MALTIDTAAPRRREGAFRSRLSARSGRTEPRAAPGGSSAAPRAARPGPALSAARAALRPDPRPLPAPRAEPGDTGSPFFCSCLFVCSVLFFPSTSLWWFFFLFFFCFVFFLSSPPRPPVPPAPPPPKLANTVFILKMFSTIREAFSGRVPGNEMPDGSITFAHVLHACIIGRSI